MDPGMYHLIFWAVLVNIVLAVTVCGRGVFPGAGCLVPSREGRKENYIAV